MRKAFMASVSRVAPCSRSPAAAAISSVEALCSSAAAVTSWLAEACSVADAATSAVLPPRCRKVPGRQLC